VLKVFMLESLFEGAVGSAVGLALGLVLSYAEGAALYGREVWGLLPAAVLVPVVIGCFLAGLALTVLGALYPAYQASRMAPVMALRTEV
jgi:putative ABC transport system permease protein